jgi:hypothetical protein
MQDTSHLHIEFFIETIEDEVASAAEGIPKFKDVELIRIKFVGDNKSVLVNPAHSVSYDPDERRQMTYAERFPRHYAAFKESNAEYVDGTPINQLPGIIASRVAEFKAQQIHSIEALAQLDGPQLTRLGMHGREWKTKALTWLEKAKEGALESRLAAQNDDLRAQLKEMQDQFAAMRAGTAMPAKDDAKIDVVQDGRFAGHTASDLRIYIKELAGTAVKGNPSLSTLKAMAEELAATAEAAA